MATILTTLGVLDESTLFRTVGVEDRPSILVLWVEWRQEDRFDAPLVRRDSFPLPKALGSVIYTSKGNVDRSNLARVVELSEGENEYIVVEIFRLGDKIVKRSPNVILKKGTEASALVGGF